MSRKTRTTVITMLAAAFVVPTTAAEAAKHPQRGKAVARAAQECPDADLEPTADNLGRVRAAIRCLHNEIRAQYEESFPGLLDKVSSSIVGLRIHAGRRAEEMDELKRTFNHHGMQSFMAPGAQKVLEAIAALDTGQASASGVRDGDLSETLELFYQKGLLQL